MKSRRGSSFRLEIIAYSLISLVLTLLTEGFIFGGIYLVLSIVSPDFINHLSGSFHGKDLQDTSFGQGSIPGYNKGPGTGSYDGYGEFKFQEQFGISIQFSREIFFTTISLAVLIGIAFFIIYFLLLTRRFTKYMTNIVYGIDKISSGDFKHQIPLESDNEFGIISDKLNKMAYQLEKIMEENEKSEKNKNAIITSLAHDLRTPLTSIIGYLDLLANNEALPDTTRKHYLEIVHYKSKDLENLINDLFDYTRVSFGEISPDKVTINMVEFINQLIDEFYPSFREHDLEYGVRIEGGSLYIEGDGELLARAISNLISNAIKYGKDGKMVNVYMKKKGDRVIIQIVNYGQLIPEEALPHVFERFYRVEGSRSSKTGGTGLGLSIAKEIVELHGGKISVKSDFKGTVFQVELQGKAGEESEKKQNDKE